MSDDESLLQAAEIISTLRKQLEEAERYAKIGREWSENSSLEKWFPFTADGIERDKKELIQLRDQHHKKYGPIDVQGHPMTRSPESTWIYRIVIGIVIAATVVLLLMR